LRSAISPIHSPQMDQDLMRGLSVRALLDEVGAPRDTAIIVDLPGPRAVAFAAALADRFEPLFIFADWPHPDELVRRSALRSALLGG
jgi:hypothetical protein